MAQTPNYNFLQAIDPTKIKVPISERFAKLTLSSNKKQQEKCNEPDQQRECRIQKEKRDSVVRNISKQFDNEIQERHTNEGQNPLLRSESSKGTEHDSSFVEHTVPEDLTMEPLEVSEDGEEKNVERVEDHFELLSQQMATLMVETKPISLSSGSTGNLSAFIDLHPSEHLPSAKSEANRIHIVHNIPINVKEAVKQQTIPLHFASSSNENLQKTSEMTEDEETEDGKDDDGDDEEEDEPITVSDTSDSHHEQEVDIMAISSLPSTSLTSENLSLPSLVADKAERVAAFLRDVSIEQRAMDELGQLVVHDTIDRILDNKEIDKVQETISKARQIATADTESMTPDVGDETTPKSAVRVGEHLKDLEVFEENKQQDQKEGKSTIGKQTYEKNINRLTNDKTLDNTIDTTEFPKDYNEETPKVVSNRKNSLGYCSPKTPKACAADIYRLANDETQCNTDLTLNQELPKDNDNSESSRRLASLETEDFSESSFKENNVLSTQNENNAESCPRRLANEDTMANSVMTHMDHALMQQSLQQRTSKNYKTLERTNTINHSLGSVHLMSTGRTDANSNEHSFASVINSSNEDANDTVPEVSIIISETDNDNSSSEEKSQSKNENSDDKKLSNSFHGEESSDDSEYEQQISKIQMSMASINISAKINIKIHIPQITSSSEDEQNNEPHTSANEVRIEQSKQLTDPTKTKTSEEENGKASSSNTHNKESSNRVLDKKIKKAERKISYEQNRSYVSNNPSLKLVTPQKPCKQVQTKRPKENIALTTNKYLDSSPEIGEADKFLTEAEKLSKESIALTNNKSLESSPETGEDDKFLTEAEKLLNQLYGQSWQTPDVIRTLKRSSQSGDKKSNNTKSYSARKKDDKKHSNEEKANNSTVVEESILHDFSMFRQNVVTTNLDSTRLATPKLTTQQKLVNFTEPRNRRKPIMQKIDANPRPQTERKTKTARVAKKNTAYNDRWRQLVDTGSNSEVDNASDDEDADESWSINGSELDVCSSDSEPEYEISSKPKPKKHKNDKTRRRARSNKSDYLTKMLNKSKDGEIIYLDLSKDEVEVQEEIPASPPVNHDITFASRLQDILKTCRHEDKAKLPSSEKKSKRKLFTPRFGDDDFENVDPKECEAKHKETNKEKNNNDDDDILHDNGNCPFDSFGRPKVFDLVNKQLESVKTGKPIFQLTPSPKRKTAKNDIVTPSSKSLTTAKSNEEANFKTPSTVKSKLQKTKVLKDLWQTPDYKYSFLKSLDVTVSKTLCNPDALYYRDNYRTKKEELSKILYDMYNNKLFDNKLEVPLLWNKKLLNTAGRCLNKKKLGVRSSVVELSEKVLTSADRLRCTLIHELCHAATWVFNGEGGHGSSWKEWARKANAIFPEIPKIGVCHQYDIEYKYTYKCTLCAAKSYAHSKSKKVENIRCSYCHGAIEVFLNKKDKDGNVVPTPVKEATGFAKFVKDNYKKFKRDDLKHADVMKLLSNEFASLKVTSS